MTKRAILTHDDVNRILDALAAWRDRATCRLLGHMWDSDRPAGPIHARDICWRCSAINPRSKP